MALSALLLLGTLTAASSKPRPYALIFGTVFDQAGHAVSGVHVNILREGERKPRWKLVSDRQGEFAQRVPAGAADYRVWAEAPGRKGHAAETTVRVLNDERVDIGLHLTE